MIQGTKSIVLATLSTERRITRDTIAAMAGSDIHFKPTDEQMCFGDQALHIISAQDTLLEAFRTGQWNWQRGIDLEHFATLPDILARFDQMHAAEQAYYDSLEPEQFFLPVRTGWGPAEPLLQLVMSFLAHEAHHRGQLAVYLRLKGITPPKY